MNKIYKINRLNELYFDKMVMSLNTFESDSRSSLNDFRDDVEDLYFMFFRFFICAFFCQSSEMHLRN